MGADPRQNSPHPQAIICMPTHAGLQLVSSCWLQALAFPLPTGHLRGLSQTWGEPLCPSPCPAILSRNPAVWLNCCRLVPPNRQPVAKNPTASPMHLTGLSPPSSPGP